MRGLSLIDSFLIPLVDRRSSKEEFQKAANWFDCIYPCFQVYKILFGKSFTAINSLDPDSNISNRKKND